MLSENPFMNFNVMFEKTMFREVTITCFSPDEPPREYNILYDDWNKENGTKHTFYYNHGSSTMKIDNIELGQFGLLHGQIDIQQIQAKTNSSGILVNLVR
eukprot:UN00240